MSRRGVQNIACKACGAVWFRQDNFERDSPGPAMHPMLLVCLCGMPVPPQLSGLRSPQQTAFLAALETAYPIRRGFQYENLPSRIALRRQIHALVQRLAQVERAARRLGKRVGDVPGGFRHVPPSRRRAATHGLDAIAVELQRAGLLTFRQARQALWAVRDAWKAALARGQTVETPAGCLVIRRQEDRPKSIKLVPHPALEFEIHANKEEVSTPMPVPTDSALCRRCGSQWFFEAEFRRYAEGFYSPSIAGGHMLSDPIRARICICGTPLEPRRLPGGRYYTTEQKSFLDSRQKAQDYLAQLAEINEKIEERLSEFASTEALAGLNHRIASAEEAIAQIQAAIKGHHFRSRRRRAQTPEKESAPGPGT